LKFPHSSPAFLKIGHQWVVEAHRAGIFGNLAPLHIVQGHRSLLVALTYLSRLRDAAFSENAFGPLTLAAVRFSGAEALSGGILLVVSVQ
jgi:hypothetical protein